MSSNRVLATAQEELEELNSPRKAAAPAVTDTTASEELKAMKEKVAALSRP